MNVPNLPLQFLTFRLQAREAVALPPFLGSTLRGAFGAALKQVFCFVPHGDCQRCWFFEACPYQHIFESPNLIPNEANHPKLRGQKQLPQPFVLIAPSPRRKNSAASTLRKPDFNDDFAANHFSRGETLEFSILLIGKATAFWAQVLVAARLLAENGLGANRISFVLAEAFANDGYGQAVKIFDARQPSVAAKTIAPVALDALAVRRVETLLREAEKTGAEDLQIEFLTPARIRVADSIAPELDAYTFFKKITERIEFLARIYSVPPVRKDYRELTGGIGDALDLRGGAFKIYSYRQFSNRQNQKTMRDVMTAAFTLRGHAIADYLPLLAAGEILHIGSNTSDGFGRFAAGFHA